MHAPSSQTKQKSRIKYLSGEEDEFVDCCSETNDNFRLKQRRMATANDNNNNACNTDFQKVSPLIDYDSPPHNGGLFKSGTDLNDKFQFDNTGFAFNDQYILRSGLVLELVSIR